MTFLFPKGACPSRKQGTVAACALHLVSRLPLATVNRPKTGKGDRTPLILRGTPILALVLSFSSLLLSSLELSDIQVYEPFIRAFLGTASHFCEVLVLKSALVRQWLVANRHVGPDPSNEEVDNSLRSLLERKGHQVGPATLTSQLLTLKSQVFPSEVNSFPS